ncbi:hypothetical protein ATANTOWER_029995, partial [Ataeniobius toweri]|nr:hypothetical protein [Ataeniobius toweri]
ANTTERSIGHQTGAHHSGTRPKNPHRQHPTKAGRHLLGPLRDPQAISAPPVPRRASSPQAKEAQVALWEDGGTDSKLSHS